MTTDRTTVPLGVFTPVECRDQLPPDADMWLPAGARLVITDAMRQLNLAAPVALRQRRIVAVDGEPGTGKTTALAALAASASVDVVRVNVKPRSTGREFMRAFHEALTGVVDPGGTQSHLESELKVLLATKPRVAIFDEAQNVGLPVLQQLRFLLGLPTGRWGLVIAGTGLLKALETEPMLASRVGLRVRTTRLTGRQLRDTLRRLHPLLAAAPPPLLAGVDAAWARGNLREWSKVLGWALELAPGQPLTRDVAEQAVSLIAGKPVHLPAAA